MKDQNIVVLIGRLVRDAEIKHTSGGMEIAEFSVAVNRSRKRGEQWIDEASFFDVTKFSPGGLANYLHKGQQVSISGELEQQRWENKEGQKRSKVVIIAREIQLVGAKGEGGRAEGIRTESAKAESGEPVPAFSDDIPF